MTDPPLAGWPVAEAARRVGVTVSTLHSWHRRYDLGPSGRTAGGHRRYTADDVARLQRLQRLVAEGVSTSAAAARVRRGTPRPAAAAATGVSPSTLLAAADRLDAPAVGRAARGLLRRHGTVTAWTENFLPALQQAGERWQYTGHGVEAEHVLTAGIRGALEARAGRRRPASPAPPVVLAATPGEQHTLPLYAVGAGLAERGIEVRVLGTLPPTGLFDAVDRLAPAAVVLWARTAATADHELLAELARRAALVCAAGSGWSAALISVAVTRDLPGTMERLTDWLG